MSNYDKKHLLNREIKDSRVFLLDKEGNKLGEIGIAEALHRAGEQDLDLVLLNRPEKGLPICKILDYQKWQYQEKKKKEEIEAKHKSQELKEFWLSPAVADNDLQIKIKKAKELLDDGHKVRFVVKPTKGKRDQYRMMQNTQMLQALVSNVLNSLSEKATLDQDYKINPGQIFGFTLKPEKKEKINDRKPKI